MVAVLVWFHVPKHIKLPQDTWTEILLQLDIPGFTVLLASLVCLTLALQYGGQTKAWSDGSTIATLVMWVVLSIAFVICEYFQGARAMMPLAKLKPRLAWTLTLYALMWVTPVEFYYKADRDHLKASISLVSRSNFTSHSTFSLFMGILLLRAVSIVFRLSHFSPWLPSLVVAWFRRHAFFILIYWQGES
jgi:hypothetical protein